MYLWCKLENLGTSDPIQICGFVLENHGNNQVYLSLFIFIILSIGFHAVRGSLQCKVNHFIDCFLFLLIQKLQPNEAYFYVSYFSKLDPEYFSNYYLH